jgi:hypothetical protein
MLAIDRSDPGDPLISDSAKVDTNNNLTWNDHRIPSWSGINREVVGIPDSSNGIQFARLWLDNAASEMEVFIARIDLMTDMRDDDTLSIIP